MGQGQVAAGERPPPAGGHPDGSGDSRLALQPAPGGPPIPFFRRAGCGSGRVWGGDARGARWLGRVHPVHSAGGTGTRYEQGCDFDDALVESEETFLNRTAYSDALPPPPPNLSLSCLPMHPCSLSSKHPPLVPLSSRTADACRRRHRRSANAPRRARAAGGGPITAGGGALPLCAGSAPPVATARSTSARSVGFD